MKTRVLCVMIVSVLAFMTFHALFSEPRYRGQTLTQWLQRYQYHAENEIKPRLEARNAVLAIGTEKALPVLLKLVETKDDPVSLWLIDKSDKYRERLVETLYANSPDADSLYDDERTGWREARDFQLLAVAGFEILGTNAAPAAGELEKLLNDRDYDWTIKRSLSLIGKPAEPVFCCALTNRDPDIRTWAIDSLIDVTSDTIVYINRIKPRLQDTNEAVRCMAVDAVGWQTKVPETAIPLLVAALNDSSDSVSSHAANALAGFGTNALPAFLILSNLVESGSANTASAALNTLITIALDAAFPILTNCLAQGKPETGNVLKTLAGIAPSKALPILLARLQSPELETKHAAFVLLLHYPATPEIETAMQTIATGSDDNMVPSAKGFLTDLFETNHPNEFFFADEPSYAGKSLGEWLKPHNDDEAFIEKAQDAVRHMGTNIIPALFKRLTYVRPPYCFSPLDINFSAAAGFIALGEQAKPALPRLWLLMDSTNEEVARAAMIATLGTGSNSMPFYIKGLTNEFPDIRNQAAGTIADTLSAKYPEQLKPAIPLFIKLLNDPDDDVRANATNQLKQIDLTTAARLGIK